MFPETNGLTLEEVDHIFIKDDDGIGYSVDVSDTQSGEKRSVAGDAHASTVERAALSVSTASDGGKMDILACLFGKELRQALLMKTVRG